MKARKNYWAKKAMFNFSPILDGYRSPTDFFRIGQNSEKYLFEH